MENPLASVIVLVVLLLLIVILGVNIFDKLTKKPVIKKAIIIKKPTPKPQPVDNDLTDTTNLLKAAF